MRITGFSGAAKTGITLKIISEKTDNYSIDTMLDNKKSNGDSVSIIPTLNKNAEKVSVALETGIYNNDFYTINISTGLKSKGGNSLSDIRTVPFYVPFH